MKKMFIAGAYLCLQLSSAMANQISSPRSFQPSLQNIPSRFATSSKTATLEWGCPVADVVRAKSKADAMRMMRAECMEQVKRAATNKPEVVDVINTSIIWPDVEVSEQDGIYSLKGTFFLETLVLQRLNTGH